MSMASSATAASGDRDVSAEVKCVLMQEQSSIVSGYLEKMSSGALFARWNRRWCVLDGTNLRYINRDKWNSVWKEIPLVYKDSAKAANRVVTMYLVDAPPLSLHFTLTKFDGVTAKLSSDQKHIKDLSSKYSFRCETEEDREKWVGSIRCQLRTFALSERDTENQQEIHKESSVFRMTPPIPERSPLSFIRAAAASPPLPSSKLEPIADDVVAENITAIREPQVSAVLDSFGFRVPHSALLKYAEWSQNREDNDKEKQVNNSWDVYLEKHPVLSIVPNSLLVIGVPDRYRWLLWCHISGVSRELACNVGVYQKLIIDCENLLRLVAAEKIEKDKHVNQGENVQVNSQSHSQSADSKEMSQLHRDIACDVDRTFPDHPEFRKETSMSRLQRVLRAFGHWNRKVGYCQGLNFVAGFALLRGDEESSFWLLVQIVDRYLKNYFVSPMLDWHVDHRVFEDILSRKAPTVYNSLLDCGYPPTLLCGQWFLCIYVKSLPAETVARVWDLFFSQGKAILFRVGIAIILLYTEEFLSCNNEGDIYTVLQRVSESLYDADELLKLALSDACDPGDLSSLTAKYHKVVSEEFQRNKEMRLRSTIDSKSSETGDGQQNPEKFSVGTTWSGFMGLFSDNRKGMFSNLKNGQLQRRSGKSAVKTSNESISDSGSLSINNNRSIGRMTASVIGCSQASSVENESPVLLLSLRICAYPDVPISLPENFAPLDEMGSISWTIYRRAVHFIKFRERLISVIESNASSDTQKVSIPELTGLSDMLQPIPVSAKSTAISIPPSAPSTPVIDKATVDKISKVLTSFLASVMSLVSPNLNAAIADSVFEFVSDRGTLRHVLSESLTLCDRVSDSWQRALNVEKRMCAQLASDSRSYEDSLMCLQEQKTNICRSFQIQIEENDVSIQKYKTKVEEMEKSSIVMQTTIVDLERVNMELELRKDFLMDEVNELKSEKANLLSEVTSLKEQMLSLQGLPIESLRRGATRGVVTGRTESVTRVCQDLSSEQEASK